MAVTVDTKIFLALYTGSGLTLNLTNAPWLANVVKIIRPSLNTGVNTRQSFNGAYGGATPGGAVSTLAQGLVYEITAGVTNNWTLPDFTRTPSAGGVTRLVATFPANVSTTSTPSVQLKITQAEQVGNYLVDSGNPLTGLTNVVYSKGGTVVTVSTTQPVALVLNDTLVITAQTAAGVEGTLTLIKA